MSDPRKGRDTRTPPSRGSRFTPRRIAQIHEVLQADFSKNPEVDQAAKRIAKTLKEGSTPNREDLAAIMMELLFRQVRSREKRERKKKKAAQATEKVTAPPPSATVEEPPWKTIALEAEKTVSKPARPDLGATGFSKGIEQEDHQRKSRGTRLRRRLRLGKGTDTEEGVIILGDPP